MLGTFQAQAWRVQRRGGNTRPRSEIIDQRYRSTLSINADTQPRCQRLQPRFRLTLAKAVATFQMLRHVAKGYSHVFDQRWQRPWPRFSCHMLHDSRVAVTGWPHFRCCHMVLHSSCVAVTGKNLARIIVISNNKNSKLTHVEEQCRMCVVGCHNTAKYRHTAQTGTVFHGAVTR